MGRGRAKAKQTKVARELKYFSPDTDLSALERELHGATSRAPNRLTTPTRCSSRTTTTTNSGPPASGDAGQ